MLTGQPPIPPERSLLTTGMLATCFESKGREGPGVARPDLDITYEPNPLPEQWYEVLH